MIDRGLFDAYARALGMNADMAKAALLALGPECEGMGAAQLAAYLKEAYPAAVAEFGAIASQCAVEFYDALREAARPPSAYGAEIYEPDDGGLLRWDVDDALDKAADLQKAVRMLAGTGQQRVMERADETLARNAELDPAHPKWALVPRPGACGWCVMVGSRGFDYRSKDTASSMRHPSCKCTPVVDFDTANPKLDGYDPDALYSEWRRGEVQKEAAALDRGMKRAWRDFKKERTEENYRKTVGKYLADISPLVSAEYMARPEGKEIQVAKWLSDISGKPVVHKLASNVPGDKTCDIEWDGMPWEIKRGESPHASKALKRIGEAAKQSPNVIYDASLRFLSRDSLTKVARAANEFDDLENLLILQESSII